MSEQVQATQRRRALRIGAGAAVGLVSLGWFVSGVDWGPLVEVLSSMHLGWLALAVVLMLLDYLLQAWRWGVLLRHVAPDLDLRTLWAATAVGWAFNTLLPLRAGNFLRPAVVAERRSVPYGTLLFTSIAEYVCDAYGVLVLLAATFYALPEGTELPGGVEGMTGSLVATALLGLPAILLLATRRARLLFLWVVFPLAHPWRRWSVDLFDQLVAGLAAVGNPWRLAEALGQTLLIWGLWLLVIESTLRAVHLQLPIGAALFLETTLTVATHVPQAPGFLGVFQLVTQESLALYDAPVAQAQAVALLLWAVCFVPITLVGLVEAWRMGLRSFMASPPVKTVG